MGGDIANIPLTVKLVLQSVGCILKPRCPLGRNENAPRIKVRQSTFYSLLPPWYTFELSEDTVLPCWGLVPSSINDTEASAGMLKYLCSPDSDFFLLIVWAMSGVSIRKAALLSAMN